MVMLWGRSFRFSGSEVRSFIWRRRSWAYQYLCILFGAFGWELREKGEYLLQID